MNFNNPYYAQAQAKRSAMRLEAQAQGIHSRHIDQFCEYANLMAEGVKQDILDALPQLIAQEMQKTNLEINVDENSLNRVRQKIEKMLGTLFNRR